MESEEIAREHQLILDLAKSNKRRIDNLEEEQKELDEIAQEAADDIYAPKKKGRKKSLNSKDNEKKESKTKPTALKIPEPFEITLSLPLVLDERSLIFF